ncbi:PorP/SprF family type IX secretion system membrane protein [Flavobacteriaceae bacterium]|nr:PorP/SprF family type IX secretion system membrane protein [Flavobacteriaceae bacterium]MDB9899783.1 PorP/SprF family type IX secretion system membrane protein [Flavobacteriaceae bacterium]
MKKNYTLLFLVFSFCCVAQQEPLWNLYAHHANLYNPASVGVNGNVAALGTHYQGIRVSNAPITRAFSLATSQESKRTGLGFSVVDDQSIATRLTQVYADFSYKLPLANDQILYLGIKGGGSFSKIKAAGLRTLDLGQDPALVNSSGFTPNIGAGFYFKHPRYHIQASIPRLVSFRDQQSLDFQLYEGQPTLYLNAGTQFDLPGEWRLLPRFLLLSYSNAPTEYLVDTAFSFKERFEVGLQWGRQNSLGATAKLSIAKNIELAYAYGTFSSSETNVLQQATHELLIKFRFNIKPPEDYSTPELSPPNIN